MKDLKLNKEVTNRLQDDEMANLVGAGPVISGSNTRRGKEIAQAQFVAAEEESAGGSSSCCQKSCK